GRDACEQAKSPRPCGRGRQSSCADRGTEDAETAEAGPERADTHTGAARHAAEDPDGLQRPPCFPSLPRCPFQCPVDRLADNRGLRSLRLLQLDVLKVLCRENRLP